MFARVITSQVGADKFGSVVRVAQEQLPAAREQPGFQGFCLLADAESGKVMTISLWETREHVLAVEAQAARVRSQAAPSIGAPQVETYEVAMFA